MNQQSKKWAVKAAWGVLIIILILAALSGTIMSRVDEPKFEIVTSEDNIQIRDYQPIIVAEVEVSGERAKSINNGFRMIADYIFGNNTTSKKIAMTAPVMQQSGEKIAMTAPVTQQGNGNFWKVRFVMPSNYTIQTLPAPHNTQVKLIEIPSKRFAVIRFSGFNSEHNISVHREKLFHYISKNKLTTVEEPVMAFYNPPWTLPFLKRNEIMIELR